MDENYRGFLMLNIGDNDKNADWIKTPENRESEAAIHEQLERWYREKRKIDRR